MATLTVWKFDTATGADDAAETLRGLATQHLITIHDAATVRWEEGKKKPKTRQLNNLAGAGALVARSLIWEQEVAGLLHWRDVNLGVLREV